RWTRPFGPGWRTTSATRTGALTRCSGWRWAGTPEGVPAGHPLGSADDDPHARRPPRGGAVGLLQVAGAERIGPHARVGHERRQHAVLVELPVGPRAARPLDLDVVGVAVRCQVRAP